MLTYTSTKWIMTLALLTAAAFGNYLLPSLASAQGGDEGVTAESAAPEASVAMDANTFISYLDSLREMGQVEAEGTAALRARERMVYDHTSYLDVLRNKAAAMSMSASMGSLSANNYISHLDRLRAMGSAPHLDANAYISHLDNLRQQGFNAATTEPTLATR